MWRVLTIRRIQAKFKPIEEWISSKGLEDEGGEFCKVNVYSSQLKYELALKS